MNPEILPGLANKEGLFVPKTSSNTDSKCYSMFKLQDSI
jgi:hypothetical protein